ncbi:MAG: peptide-methionine (S)-S-oxide reductase MsrA [Sphingobacteriaceae bacterium]|nr:peptide-methionine (S)-S-oxide reductase MsrA [Sphingobacteriaceae bacterium]
MFKKIILLTLILLMMNEANAQQQKTEKATFGMGCFWCTEAIFQRLEGVISVKSGYEGGDVENPSYEEICTGTTNHAEVIQLTYNPLKITYSQLLEIFWENHDPTTLNRQGADVGTQYRSVVFYHNASQKDLAEKYKMELNKNKVFDKPVVTQIAAASTFYLAENYHQNYFNQNKEQAYCRLVIMPKIQKLEKIFKSKLKR